MKKFERLPVESRKEEIKKAAIRLFLEKGFRATTMENIVASVSLSKGGVYRIYPSTTSILSDIILDGGRLRNQLYRQLAQQRIEKGEEITLASVAEIICEGMIAYPEIAEIYTEFLIEKRRIPELEVVYQEICLETTKQTLDMIAEMGLQDKLNLDSQKTQRLLDVMNTTILGIVILNQRDSYETIKPYLLSILNTSLRKDD